MGVCFFGKKSRPNVNPKMPIATTNALVVVNPTTINPIHGADP
jgi:hypothetical protein